MIGVSADTRLVRTEGVTAPAGFRAAGIAAGIKASGSLDLALVFNEGPGYGAAGVFTRNQVKAAPVWWTQHVVSTGRLRAVILNSGGANACTGADGYQDAYDTAEAVAAALSDRGTATGATEVAVCSTGLIGDRLPMDKVLAGVQQIVHELAGGQDNGEQAARAIMTTDTVPKQVALHDGDNWAIGGMAKGAGMLAPSLATMLCVLTTDAVADTAALDRALRRATELTLSGSISTAAPRPTTPCCCWRRVPAHSRRPRTISTMRCCGSVTIWPPSCGPTPRVSPNASRSR